MNEKDWAASNLKNRDDDLIENLYARDEDKDEQQWPGTDMENNSNGSGDCNRKYDRMAFHKHLFQSRKPRKSEG